MCFPNLIEQFWLSHEGVEAFAQVFQDIDYDACDDAQDIREAISEGSCVPAIIQVHTAHGSDTLSGCLLRASELRASSIDLIRTYDMIVNASLD